MIKFLHHNLTVLFITVFITIKARYLCLSITLIALPHLVLKGTINDPNVNNGVTYGNNRDMCNATVLKIILFQSKLQLNQQLNHSYLPANKLASLNALIQCTSQLTLAFFLFSISPFLSLCVRSRRADINSFTLVEKSEMTQEKENCNSDHQ